MMRTLAADWVFTGTRLLKDHSLQLNADGQVISISEGKENGEYFPGLLCPGFVNAHCHLELSHLHGLIPKGTGMAGFVRKLQAIRRDFSKQEKQSAIEQALNQMERGGICAVGDICNGNSSLAAKQARPAMLFHNFIEVFGADPGRAEEIVYAAMDLVQEMGPRTSMTLHAPYSISKSLRDIVIKYAEAREWLQSIHLLESQEERALFEDLDGPLMAMLRDFGLVFQAHTFDSPMRFLLENFPSKVPLLLVHNTEMSSAELQWVKEEIPLAHFVLCPNANQYIHGRLPEASLFESVANRVCLGTDSLAGNDSLDIYSEMRTLQVAFGTPTETLLRWASFNGGKALGLPLSKFSIEKGNHPTLLHISGLEGENAILPENPVIRRLH